MGVFDGVGGGGVTGPAVPSDPTVKCYSVPRVGVSRLPSWIPYPRRTCPTPSGE